MFVTSTNLILISNRTHYTPVSVNLHTVASRCLSLQFVVEGGLRVLSSQLGNVKHLIDCDPPPSGRFHFGPISLDCALPNAKLSGTRPHSSDPPSIEAILLLCQTSSHSNYSSRSRCRALRFPRESICTPQNVLSNANHILAALTTPPRVHRHFAAHFTPFSTAIVPAAPHFKLRTLRRSPPLPSAEATH